MRRTIFILCLILTSGTLLAKDANRSVGIQAGFTQPTYRLNSPTSFGESQSHTDARTMNGFKIGLVYDENLIAGFGFSLGLNYTFAAGQSAWADYGYEPSGKTTLLSTIDYRTQYRYHQGEVFVDWQYKFEIAQRTFLMLYTGPTLQVASYKADDQYRNKDGSALTMSVTHTSYAAEQDAYIRPLNVTWGIGAGFQFDRYFIRGGYDFGIMNPYKEITFNALRKDGDDRWTRGRLDQWQVKVGVYLWQQND